MVVCCEVWTRICGESWHAIKDSLTHCQAPVLKAGHLVSDLFMCKCTICVVCVLGWRVGVDSDFSINYTNENNHSCE